MIKTRVTLLAVAGGLAYAVADQAGKINISPPFETALLPLAAAPAGADAAAIGAAVPAAAAAAPASAIPGSSADQSRRGNRDTLIRPPNPAAPAPQVIVAVPVNQGASEQAASAAPARPRAPRASITVEATPVIVPPEKEIPLLGPVLHERAFLAAVIRPFLLCTVEILERGTVVSRQSMGCTQADDGERPSMLMEFGQEVPNEIPNMKYWISVQVDGYRSGYPILRTRMEMNGLLGRAVGRRKYESVTVVEPNRRHTVMAFNIDDDDFQVRVAASEQK